MSEFFAEEEDLPRINASSLTPEQMRRAQKVMMSFPKDQLTPEDSEPILRAGRKIMFGSTLVTVGTFLLLRRIPNIPKQLPALASLSACIIAGRFIADNQRVAMWEGILNGKTKRSIAIIKALHGHDYHSEPKDKDTIVAERPVRIAFPTNAYSGLPTRDLTMTNERKQFRTWDDIRQEASSRQESSFEDEKDAFKNE